MSERSQRPAVGVKTQLALFAVVAGAACALLMAALAWAAGRTGPGAALAAGVDAGSGTVTLVLREEPPQLDSTLATDTVSSMVLGHVMEGLLRHDARGRLVPGVAERWTIDGADAVFHLRPDARWSDGAPVTAHDFVFAWRTAVDPATASQYAFILFPVANAEAVNRGELPPTALGVEAVDARTLRVRLERPLAYFDRLVTFFTYYPIREDFHRAAAGRYGADVDTLLYNGPFVLARWVHGAHLRLEKNPRYWNQDLVQVRALDFPYVTQDPSAHLNLFKDGRIAYTTLSQENLSEAMARRWQLQRFMNGSVAYLALNFRDGRPTRSWHLRRALQLTLDPAEIVYRVVKLPGYLPGASLFPVWLRGAAGPLRQEYPAPVAVPDRAAARRHLDLAREELGVAALPPLVLLVDDDPQSGKLAEYLQETLGRNLGLAVRIDRQIFKQRLAKMAAGEFDLVQAAWYPDFDDPLTFGDLYASWNLNNRGRYASAALDGWVRTAQEATDPVQRAAAFGAIQQILFDDVALLPLYERGEVYVVDPRVTGLVRRVVGPDPDFTHVRLADG